MKRQRTIFYARVGECVLQKKCAGTHYTEVVFLHPVGSGSRSAFRCIRGAKCRCNIFHAWVGLVRISQKVCRDTLR
jgi:hypothetical protein